uniref:Uncharacterized protein n=1 Tax=Acrobeloides nanus TaxID=290746 RepID=A0A914DTP6_9BILA
MKTWKDVFFKTLHSKITESVFYLMERENAEDKTINTKIIPNEVIQSFKMLDIYKRGANYGSWYIFMSRWDKPLSVKNFNLFVNDHFAKVEESIITP